MRGSGAFRAAVAPGGGLAGPWVRDPLWRRAKAVPSLDLRFADRKDLVDAVTGQSLVTFTRNSSATYMDSDGVLRTASTNVPRFYHNPTTGECLGLLVEEQRTNLKTYSEEITATNGYALVGSTLSLSTISTPISGVSTASLFALNNGENTGNSSAGFNFGSTLTLTNLTAYIQSVFVRMSGATIFRLRSNVTGQIFDITPVNGAPVPTGTITACAVEPFPDNWYRISWGFTTTSAAPGNRPDHWSIKSNVANGSSGFYVTGAQLEAGAFPTSYIPTTSSTVTRSADVASITTAGAAVRSMYAQFRSPASGTRGIASLDDNSANNRIELLTSGTDPRLTVTTSGSAVADIDAGTVTANTTTRLAGIFDVDNYAASVGGAARLVDTSGAYPAVDRIRIGAQQAGNYLNGPIARLAMWNSTALPLEALTQ